jgi:hypothetical protein
MEQLTKLQHLTRSTDLLNLFNTLHQGHIDTIVSHGIEDILIFHAYYSTQAEKDIVLNFLQEMSQYHAHQAHNMTVPDMAQLPALLSDVLLIIDSLLLTDSEDQIRQRVHRFADTLK